MLIHSYLTDGFFEMGKVFLRSLSNVHKPYQPPAFLDTRNLNSVQVDELYECYPKELLHIHNEMLPIRQWAASMGMPLAQLKEYKRQIEQRYVSEKNKVWKLLVAGDNRVASLYRCLFSVGEYPDKWEELRPDFIAHFDIDTLFRKPLGPTVPNLMKEADIYLKLRPNHNIIKARITIDCILVRPTDGVKAFFDEWRRQINRVPPLKRPRGFGQSSCWFAFEKTKNIMNYKKLPIEFGLPGRNKDDQLVWCGNVHKLRKDDCVEFFKKEAGLK